MLPTPCAGTGASKGTTSSIKGVSKGGVAGRLAGSTETSFVHPSQGCSVPAVLSGQMAGQHLLTRQEADKKYDLSLSQHGFSSSLSSSSQSNASRALSLLGPDLSSASLM